MSLLLTEKATLRAICQTKFMNFQSIAQETAAVEVAQFMNRNLLLMHQRPLVAKERRNKQQQQQTNIKTQKQRKNNRNGGGGGGKRHNGRHRVERSANLGKRQNRRIAKSVSSNNKFI